MSMSMWRAHCPFTVHAPESWPITRKKGPHCGKFKRINTEPHPQPFSSSCNNFATTTPKQFPSHVAWMITVLNVAILVVFLHSKIWPGVSIDKSTRSKLQNPRPSVQHDLDFGDGHDFCKDQRQRTRKHTIPGSSWWFIFWSLLRTTKI